MLLASLGTALLAGLLVGRLLRWLGVVGTFWRLRLLDAHRQRVDAQIQALEECRSVITWKVGVYTEHFARGEAGGLWDPTA